MQKIINILLDKPDIIQIIKSYDEYVQQTKTITFLLDMFKYDEKFS